MDGNRRAELETIMAGLAAGDPAMVVALVDRFGAEIRRTLVALAREADLEAPTEDLDGLVYEAAAELARVAGGWRPEGGAVPWVWARHRLVRLLRAASRPPGLLVEDALWGRDAPEPTPVAWSRADPPAIAVLAGAARRHHGAALVHEALTLVVREADREVLLRHADQVSAGDPSPAVTLAREFGRSPDAVRQAVSRSRRRLHDLASADARFRPLLRLPLLGALAIPDREVAA